MTKTIKITLIVVAIAIIATLWISYPFGSSVRQPIDFNHQLHVEEVGVECLECHPYFQMSRSSGLPNEETCIQCHEEPVGESREEMKLSAILQSGEGLMFRKLLVMPEHVNYSHRTHIVVAELACEKCHGQIAATTLPPGRPLIQVDMEYCMDCHEKYAVTNDCIACHM